MQKFIKKIAITISQILNISFLLWAANFVQANDLDMKITITQPQLNEQPYHKPYIAVWLETPQRKAVATIDLWYQQKDDGDKWLKDLRQWWRKTGQMMRKKELDALSGATRLPKAYVIKWDGKDNAGKALVRGEYLLNIEAAREDGGRSYLRQSIDTRKAGSVNIAAELEIGPVKVEWN